MTFTGSINNILHVVLMLSIGVVYGRGTTVIEIEHEHSNAPAGIFSGSSHHDHHHHHEDSGSDHHDRGDNPDDGEEPTQEDDSSPHRHSHVLTIDTHAVPSPVKVPFSKVAFRSSKKRFPEKELCPDSPYYALSKPPQLG
ncbi:MAG: hypothetical protein ACJAVK_002638 [Akkermansiaceae bacterium]